jgi:anti-sigma28 factor (negative regulator of flagellin synthesis)
MRVENSLTAANLEGITSSKDAPSSNRPTELETQANDSFAPSSELVGYLAAIRNVPDVRTERIAEISAKIAAGELTNSTSAIQTANAITESLEGIE